MRPEDFESFHGQAETIENLKIVVKSALRQEKPLGHILFTGPAGLGKTTLGISVLPTEMGCDATHVNCAAIEKAQDLTVVLSTMRAEDILFLDELHALPFAAREHLLTVMEDQKINLSIGEGDAKQVLEIVLPKFTIIGATTRQGALDGPLRSRFANIYGLRPYDSKEMLQVLQWLAENRGCCVEVKALGYLIPPIHGVARKAVNLLEACIDTYFASDPESDTPIIDVPIVRETLGRLAYVGPFAPEEVRYLEVLVQAGRPVGVKAIAAQLDETVSTVEEVYEPWLARKGFVRRDANGRSLTQKGEDAFRKVIIDEDGSDKGRGTA